MSTNGKFCRSTIIVFMGIRSKLFRELPEAASLTGYTSVSLNSALLVRSLVGISVTVLKSQQRPLWGPIGGHNQCLSTCTIILGVHLATSPDPSTLSSARLLHTANLWSGSLPPQLLQTRESYPRIAYLHVSSVHPMFCRFSSFFDPQ